MFKNIQLDAPSLGQIEKDYLCRAVDSGFISSMGPFVPEFEQEMAKNLGVQAAVAVQSGTSAIYMALHELGIKAHDEVIVPALTFAATVNPILYAGATPVIVDVDPQTWNIDVKQIKKAITKKTKAIIPVHLYGNPCAIADIMALAKEYGLYVIEDATEGLGARIEGKCAGTFGDFGCFSFNGNKVITTGGGGMVIGKKKESLDHIRYLINQSQDRNKPGYHLEMGFNYRMTNIEAALGLAQLERLNNFLVKKKAYKNIYKNTFKSLSRVRFQQMSPGDVESAWLTGIYIKDADINDVIEKLKSRNIPTRRVFMPLGQMPYLAAYTTDCPHAADIYSHGLCLPSSTLNEEKEIEEVAASIREVLSG